MERMMVIRMIKDVPHQAVAKDLRVYGPFKAGERYLVPESIGKPFVFWHYAEEV